MIENRPPVEDVNPRHNISQAEKEIADGIVNEGYSSVDSP
jgi:hypothetical protein